ncbi:MAG TPA: hypothetical protein VFQ22_10155 [Longimicrobiales bacterium]|nr:hypothetical protein [Longimicrobiales bacterium]
MRGRSTHLLVPQVGEEALVRVQNPAPGEVLRPRLLPSVAVLPVDEILV